LALLVLWTAALTGAVEGTAPAAAAEGATDVPGDEGDGASRARDEPALLTTCGYGTNDCGYLKISPCSGWSLDAMETGAGPAVCTTVRDTGSGDGDPATRYPWRNCEPKLENASSGEYDANDAWPDKADTGGWL